MYIEKVRPSVLTPAVTQKDKAPFGAHFAVRIESVNNKLLCALAATNTCGDDPVACIELPE